MGYKSALRSLAAAEKRRQREAVRHKRELERQRKHAEKLEAIELARLEVEEYENYLDLITSVHKECGPAWNWEEIQAAEPPEKPAAANFRNNTKAAQLAYETYEPGRLDRMLRRVDSVREKLAKAIKEAKSEDIAEYKEALAEYEKQYSEWEELRKIAVHILNDDPEAYQYAIQQYGPFDEIQEFGSEIRFRSDDLRLFELEIKVNGEDIIPDQSITLLKGGKLSTKKMTKTLYYELYQDYVCGCTLRVARELFALVPFDVKLCSQHEISKEKGFSGG